MALKRRNKILATFSMSSMTDVIFLLLIFFMVTSNIVFPNALKVLLPQSKQQTVASPQARIIIEKKSKEDNEPIYSVAFGNQKSITVDFDDISPWLSGVQAEAEDMYVTLFADEEISYKEIVKILNIGVENGYKMVLATRPMK